MDRLADGTYALIDYKTGAQLTPRMWMDERPDEPQLPLYAVSAGEKVKAVAFARLKTGAMRYMGYAAAKEALPGLTHYPTWDELLQGWKTELEELAAGYAQGAAQVDPKRGLATCRYCDLKPLCRVHERLSALAEDGEERE
jgi:RecB family exonuclease